MQFKSIYQSNDESLDMNISLEKQTFIAIKMRFEFS